MMTSTTRRVPLVAKADGTPRQGTSGALGQDNES
jgi:hypothetical protein